MKKKSIIIIILCVLIIIVGYVLYKNTIEPVSYKPNIYLYPQKNSKLNVTLNFPNGGQVIKSIPEYGKGWNVQIDKTGKIDSKYNYLFYESKQPDKWQYETGWEIEKKKLKSFFVENMTRYGFNQDEIDDFTEYWIPRLNSHDIYQIYPQEAAVIDNLIELKISVKPDNILRLFYLIKGVDQKENIKKHTVPKKLNRKGFVVTEWGVLM